MQGSIEQPQHIPPALGKRSDLRQLPDFSLKPSGFALNLPPKRQRRKPQLERRQVRVMKAQDHRSCSKVANKLSLGPGRAVWGLQTRQRPASHATDCCFFSCPTPRCCLHGDPVRVPSVPWLRNHFQNMVEACIIPGPSFHPAPCCDCPAEWSECGQMKCTLHPGRAPGASHPPDQSAQAWPTSRLCRLCRWVREGDDPRLRNCFTSLAGRHTTNVPGSTWVECLLT